MALIKKAEYIRTYSHSNIYIQFWLNYKLDIWNLLLFCSLLLLNDGAAFGTNCITAEGVDEG